MARSASAPDLRRPARDRLTYVSLDPSREQDRHHLTTLLCARGLDGPVLADRLLERFGSFRRVVAASRARLANATDYATADAITAFRQAMLYHLRSRFADRPLLSCWRELETFLQAELAGSPVERFRVFYLDIHNRLLGETTSDGSIDQAPAYTREIVHVALDLGASAVILVHNHPSESPTPTHSDIEVTRHIQRTCTPLGIVVHDHLIIAAGQTVSMRACGLLLADRAL